MSPNTKKHVAAVMLRREREKELRAAQAIERVTWCALSPEEEREADAILHAPESNEDVTVIVNQP